MQARSCFTIILLFVFFCPGVLLGKSKLPYEFGGQVPLYSSAQSVETRYTRNSVTVQFATVDSYERVFSFYVKALEEAGWRILPATSRAVIKAEKLNSGTGDIDLTVTEVSAIQGDSAGFVIELIYPGGRE